MKKSSDYSELKSAFSSSSSDRHTLNPTIPLSSNHPSLLQATQPSFSLSFPFSSFLSLSDSNFQQESKVQFVYDAVYALAFALRSMRKQYCPESLPDLEMDSSDTDIEMDSDLQMDPDPKQDHDFGLDPYENDLLRGKYHERDGGKLGGNAEGRRAAGKGGRSNVTRLGVVRGDDDVRGRVRDATRGGVRRGLCAAMLQRLASEDLYQHILNVSFTGNFPCVNVPAQKHATDEVVYTARPVLAKGPIGLAPCA